MAARERGGGRRLVGGCGGSNGQWPRARIVIDRKVMPNAAERHGGRSGRAERSLQSHMAAAAHFRSTSWPTFPLEAPAKAAQ